MPEYTFAQACGVIPSVSMRQDAFPVKSVRLGSSTFSLWQMILLVLLTSIVFGGVWSAHKAWLGEENVRAYGLYDSVIGTVIVAVIALAMKPKFLTLSRWNIRVTDIVLPMLLGVTLGAAQSWVSRWLPPPTGRILSTEHMFIPVALLGPIFEEIVCRGVFLRSLVESSGPYLSILMVSVLFAGGHQHFWIALASQLAISATYVVFRYSLVASTILHIAFNVMVFFHVAGRVAGN